MDRLENSIALVLGSGGARGLAHIGVLKCLEEHHIAIHAIVGTSIGAFIGGLYASGMDAGTMEDIVRSLDRLAVVKIFMPGFSSSAIVDSTRARRYIARLVGEKRIEKLPVTFRAVSTDLITGEEFVFDRGVLADAILASCTFPGLFQPAYFAGRYFVDGGLCNPLPVSVAHRLHPQRCIAVNVSPNPERIRKRIQKYMQKKDYRRKKTMPSWFIELSRRGYSSLKGTLKIPPRAAKSRREEYVPTALRVSLQSIAISSHNLIQQHLKQAQPDILISPRIEEYDMLEFYKGADIIQCGYEAAEGAMPEIEALLR